MFNKTAMDKIAHEYYNAGIQLVLQQAGLHKVANPTKSKKPKQQTMTKPPMKVKPSEAFQNASKRKSTGRLSNKDDVQDYLGRRREQIAYSNAGLPSHGPEEEKMLLRSFDDEEYAKQIERKLKQGDPG